MLSGLVAAPVCNGEERCYLDPMYGTVRQEELSRPTKPLLLKLTMSLSIDGKPAVAFDEAREGVAEFLRQTGLIRSSYTGEDGSIAVTVNTSYRDKTKTWLRRAGPGRTTRWSQGLTVAITIGGVTTTKTYEHARLCFQGGAKEPEGLTGPMEHVQAMRAASEQIWLRALRDFQQEGVIAKGVEEAPPVN
jgi:hypothetical protein